MTILKTMEQKKTEFLQTLKAALGNVSVACNNSNLSRETHYRWMREDEEYRKAAMDIREVRKDFIESALDKKIQEGDTTAIIFAAKTICKDRGYVEKQQIEATAPILQINAPTQEGANIIQSAIDEFNSNGAKDS